MCDIIRQRISKNVFLPSPQYCDLICHQLLTRSCSKKKRKPLEVNLETESCILQGPYLFSSSGSPLMSGPTMRVDKKRRYCAVLGYVAQCMCAHVCVCVFGPELLSPWLSRKQRQAVVFFFFLWEYGKIRQRVEIKRQKP